MAPASLLLSFLLFACLRRPPEESQKRGKSRQRQAPRATARACSIRGRKIPRRWSSRRSGQKTSQRKSKASARKNIREQRMKPKVTPVGPKPTPLRNGALSHRLRPLGQSVHAGESGTKQNNKKDFRLPLVATSREALKQPSHGHRAAASLHGATHLI